MKSNCIYCGTSFDPTRGEGDHVLPCALFGEFEGDVRFRGACVRCNNALGQNEQKLAQASPLGFFRWVVRPNRRRRKDSGLVQKGAGGCDAPTFTAEYEHGPMLVRPTRDDPSKSTPVDQIVVSEKQGKHYCIPWFPGVGAERVRAEMDRRQIGEFETIRFEADSAHIDELRSVLAEIFPGWKTVQDYQMEPGTHLVHGRATFYFTTWYYQALAKIAFHYYLCHNLRGLRGDEPAFGPIRNFIQHGGEKDQFFQSSGRHVFAPFGQMAGGIITSPTWIHLFAGHEVDRTIVVYMQLFVGPDHVSRPFYITLGTTNSRLFLPANTGLWGHMYEYDAERTDREAGRVTKASFSLVNVG